MNKILDAEAPMGVIQMRTNYSNWITNETKLKMTERDLQRALARRTQNELERTSYRSLRNSCTRMQKLDKANYLKKSLTKLSLKKTQGSYTV